MQDVAHYGSGKFKNYYSFIESKLMCLALLKAHGIVFLCAFA